MGSPTSTPIDTLLIANRGEIAVRIARTAHRLGMSTVGVYSEADRDALHVDAVDIAVALGGSTPADSYLRGDLIIEAARRAGANLPYRATTAYVNTIHLNDEARNPGDPELEYRIRSIVRWNAMAMVVKANTLHSGLGGHISTFEASGPRARACPCCSASSRAKCRSCR